MRNIIQIVLNKDNKYIGDLKYYFRIIWHSPNILKPYHGLRHILHVMWDVYNAFLYYEKNGNVIEPRTFRNMLIAALFHDYNHTGRAGNDSVNIRLALDGLRTHILPQDEDWFDDISSYIKATEFPHSHDKELSLAENIMRDADISYTLSDSWIQLVAFQLNREMNLSPEEMLKSQEPFMRHVLKFSTDWGKEKYADKLESRIEEVRDMISVLYT